jgi:hypothetical protein
MTGNQNKLSNKGTYENVINGQTANVYYRNQLYSSCSALDLMRVTYEDEEDAPKCCKNCFDIQNQLNVITAELISIKSQVSLLIDSKAAKWDISASSPSKRSLRRGKVNNNVIITNQTIEAQVGLDQEISDQDKHNSDVSNDNSAITQIQNYNKHIPWNNIVGDATNQSCPTMRKTIPAVPTLDVCSTVSKNTCNDTEAKFAVSNDNPASNQIQNHNKHISWNHIVSDAANQSCSTMRKTLPVVPTSDVFSTVSENTCNDTEAESAEVKNRGTAHYRREQCIIVKGIPESLEGSPKEKVRRDLEQFQDCVMPLLAENDRIQVLRAHRLGTDTSNQRPRPLKVILRDPDQSQLLLKRKGLLRSNNPNVFFQPDYPPKERQKFRELYSELKSRKEKGETGIRIQNGQIIQSNQTYLWNNPFTIVKVPKSS